MSNTAQQVTAAALEHAKALALNWVKTGEEPSPEDYFDAARKVAEAVPGLPGDIAELGVEIASIIAALCFIERRDNKAAALGSAAGIRARYGQLLTGPRAPRSLEPELLGSLVRARLGHVIPENHTEALQSLRLLNLDGLTELGFVALATGKVRG